MPSFCCFLHPAYSKDDRSLSDQCPECNRAYGFPLESVPEHIKDYDIVEPLDRGFYSAAYVAQSGPFARKRVLKVVPVAVYEYFGKDFEAECKEHARAAEGSQHIVHIHDMLLNVDVTFGDTTIQCHVAELDYVDGLTLHRFLSKTGTVSAVLAAQLAIDMFSLLGELQSRDIHHNDLHSGNLVVERLGEHRLRAEAEDPSVRLVAIDLNSVADHSTSDLKKQRYGDVHWVVSHLRELVDRLMRNPSETDDIDYRLAGLLEERAQLLSPGATSQRTPSCDECIQDIRSAVRAQRSPWLEQPRLRRFRDAYNAQTLQPWFVPYLLVDPDEQWLSAISTQGPQVIVGMRGCGKTMLLRALQFHARATIPDSAAPEKDILARLRQDGYVGLYASCTKLLDVPGSPGAAKNPHARLYVAYAIEAIRALRHLREIDASQVRPGSHREIGQAVADYVGCAADAATATSEYQVERILVRALISLGRGDVTSDLDGHPAVAFPHLAEAIIGTAETWDHSQVLFLLDDVTTRFIDKPSIQSLFSSLLFSTPTAAFKLTTEAQTLELILKSPGQIEYARRGRDYEVFDLGAEVNAMTKASKGTRFIERVLSQRSRYFQSRHLPQAAPSTVLGNATLESLAAKIARSPSTSRVRKRVYHGITALAHVCVGDIGDVISIYDGILRRAAAGGYPVSEEVQTDCFQDFCSRRLYDLNRRSSDLKDYALGFAEASSELLKQSYSEYQRKRATGQRGRLRQYAKVYVRVTTGDTEGQFERLRKLIDAGVFVLDGGTHRSKTRDSDPIQQFKLTYRKLYGLSSFIGLSERDRYELSGKDLEEWLSDPSQCKEILLRNLGATEAGDEIVEEDEACVAAEGNEDLPTEPARTRLLWEELEPDTSAIARAHVEDDLLAGVASRGFHERKPCWSILDPASLEERDIDVLVVGLGFEARTAVSATRIVRRVRPHRSVCVRYKEEGRSEQIKETVGKQGIQEVDYTDVLRNGFELPKGLTLVDVTGLAKPAIWHAITGALQSHRRVIVCHTEARSYYPLDADLAPVLDAEVGKEYITLLDKLGQLLTGEQGPYELNALMMSHADDTRRRFLFAFASPKHERLLAMLDRRDFDKIQVVTQRSDTPRGKLAQLAADFVVKNVPGAEALRLDSNDLGGILDAITSSYHKWYVDAGLNFECGLTGSKLQAVGCAAAAAAFKFSQAWYVQPQRFDPNRFTKGVGATQYYEVWLR